MSQRVLLVAVVVLLGGAALLDVAGVVPGAGVGAIPFLLLLAAGFAVWRAAWPRRAAETATDWDIPLLGVGSARLDLTFGAGELSLSAETPAGILLAGRCAGAARQRVDRADGEAAITLRQPLSLLGRRRADWRLMLSPAVTWGRIRVAVGASQAALDFSGLAVEALILEAVRTRLEALLPRRGEVVLQLSGGRATLHVPGDVPAEVINEVLLGAVTIDKGRFTADETGERWVTPDYAGGEDGLRLRLKGGLGEIRVVIGEAGAINV